MEIWIILVSLSLIWLSFSFRLGWSIIIVPSNQLCSNRSANYKYSHTKLYSQLEWFVISIRFYLRVQSWELMSNHEIILFMSLFDIQIYITIIHTHSIIRFIFEYIIDPLILNKIDTYLLCITYSITMNHHIYLVHQYLVFH